MEKTGIIFLVVVTAKFLPFFSSSVFFLDTHSYDVPASECVKREREREDGEKRKKEKSTRM